MNKKGFTLIELLAVLVVLGIVIVVAINGVGGITEKVNNEMLDKKLSMIEEAASIYGEDFKTSLINSGLKYDGYTCKNVYVSSLVPDYLDVDNDNTCLTCKRYTSKGICSSWSNNASNAVGCIVNPAKSNTYLDKTKIIIYIKNKRIQAVADIDGTKSCS